MNRLLSLIKFILEFKAWKRPKDEKQAVLEYKRRGYLFIMQKNSVGKMRTKKPMRDLRHHFQLNGLGPQNYMGPIVSQKTK